jgi:hypothetical protein
MKKWMQGLFICAITCSLVGCGQVSLFKGLSTAKARTPLEQIQANNNSGSNYQNSISLAEQIISSNASASTKQAAQQLKGEAILGKNGVKAVDIATKLLSSTQPTANLLSILPKVSAADALQAAKALNAADALSASSNTALEKNYQVTRAMANTLAIVSKVDEVYTVGENGSLTIKGDAAPKDALADLFEADSDGKTLDYYANQANDGFDKGGTLSSSQQTQMNKVKNITAELKALNDAAQANNTSYTYTNSNNVVTSVDTTNSSALNTAITEIMKKANK